MFNLVSSLEYADVFLFGFFYPTFLSACQAFKAIKSFLSKLETVSEDPTKLADVGM